MKTLIVDASSAETLFLRHCVQRQGGIALHTTSGYEALELFEHEKPDMVLLDVALPDLSGFEVARRIRATEDPGNWTPIIFVTGKTCDKDVEKGIAAGGDDYLFKPISEVVLAAKIRAMHRIVQMRTSLLVLTRKLDTANQELQRLSASDGLTGIPNRRFFDETLKREWRRHWRSGQELAMIMCDVDYFKRFNDRYGHQAGDDCLRLVAHTLYACLERGGDTPARYGGEEFAVILPDTSIAGAQLVAEKTRQAIMAQEIVHADSPHGHVSLSLGVASIVPREDVSPETLLQAADTALYAAKHEGRNRVCLAQSPTFIGKSD